MWGHVELPGLASYKTRQFTVLINYEAQHGSHGTRARICFISLVLINCQEPTFGIWTLSNKDIIYLLNRSFASLSLTIRVFGIQSGLGPLRFPHGEPDTSGSSRSRTNQPTGVRRTGGVRPSASHTSPQNYRIGDNDDLCGTGRVDGQILRNFYTVFYIFFPT